jgi:hypothetical protein
MVHLTTWEAEKGGYLQGAATPGQVVGRAVDLALKSLRKLPQLPNIEPNKGHWKTWPEGDPIGVSEEWISRMISDGRLPSRNHVIYCGAHSEKSLMRAMTGTHVIVEMLDTDRKTRHRCILLGNVLLAEHAGWEASLKTTA